MTDPKNNILCPLLWIQSFINTDGYVYPCCVSDSLLSSKTNRINLNNKVLKKARLQSLSGNFPDICQKCKYIESIGHSSHRHSLGLSFNHISDKIDKVIGMTNLEGSIKTPPLFYDIRTSNICNLSCRMCGPKNSKAWYSDWKKLYPENTDNDFNSNWFDINFQNELVLSLKKTIYYWGFGVINIAGGEPFQDYKCLNLLDELIANKMSKNIDLILVSNLTKIDKSIYNRLDMFKSVVLNISIEGIGKTNNYIRYPSNWENVSNNILEVNKKNYSSLCVVSLSIYSILYVDETLNWFDDNSITAYFKYVYCPEYLFVGNFPMIFDPTIARLKTLLNSNKLKSKYLIESGRQILEYLESTPKTKSSVKEFWDFNNKLDDIRNQKLQDYLPELYECLVGVKKQVI